MKKVIYVKANERYDPRYCARTVFVQDEQGQISVIKKPSSQMAAEHIHNMYVASFEMENMFQGVKVCHCRETEDGICFEYVRHKSDWLEKLTQNAKDKNRLLETWREFLSLIEPRKSQPFKKNAEFEIWFGDGSSFEGERAYPSCAVDLTPSNVLITENNENVLIDYEWYISKTIPIQLIKYHAVKVTVDSNPVLLESIGKEELFDALGLSDPQKKLAQAEFHFYVQIYGTMNSGAPFDQAYSKGEMHPQELEKKIGILKDLVAQLKTSKQSADEKLQEKVKENYMLSESVRSTTEELRKTTNELKRTQDQLLLAWNSKSWKLTAPLRFIKRMAEEGKNPIVEGFRKIQIHKTQNPIISNSWLPVYLEKYERKQEIISKENAKRLVVMYFYDKYGIADETAVNLADGLKAIADTAVLVVGGSIAEDAKNTFERIFDRIYYKKNEGFDFHGYREGLLKEGWRKVSKYDEVVLCNFTIMGPVSPLQDVFDKMKQVDCDFWGITSHPGFEFDPFQCNPYGYIPEHIQSYFLVFRQNMVKSRIFQKFWERLPRLETYDQAVGMAETVLTRYFEEAGFVWKSYVDKALYYPLTDNPLMVMPVELIRDWGCPFFKNRVFFQDYDYYITNTCGQTAVQLISFLKEKGLYDVDLLMKHLLRVCHMSDLTENLHLTHVYSTEDICSECAQRKMSSAAVIHIYDISLIDNIIRYCKSLPAETDIYISTTEEKKQKKIEEAFSTLNNKVCVQVGENRGRDLGGLLVLFREKIKKYDLICVTHDKQTAHLKPLSVGEGFAYSGYTNILETSQYVQHIIQCFESEPRLGLLKAPMSYHANFGSQMGTEWGLNYDATLQLYQELQLSCPIDREHPPCAPFGSNFWARTKAIKPLLDKQWTYEDFPEEPLKAVDGTILQAIERIYPYCVQSEGYYVSTVMTDAYASLDMSTLYFYSTGWGKIMADIGVIGKYVDVRNDMARRLHINGDRTS